ncbi:hypothetical protein QP028_02320 [Corynebacterium suedekumii]|nr:hypothetical protein QP028_02320 [Corynebacterium suedekumii]
MTATVLYQSLLRLHPPVRRGSREPAGHRRAGDPGGSLAYRRPPAAPLIVLSPVHGPAVAGADLLKKLDLTGTPAALCSVGMTLSEEARDKDRSAGLLGEKKDAVTRFYLPGRMNYSELTGRHRTIMRTIITAIRMKPGKSDNDRAMIDAYDRDVDRVDLAELDPVVAWARANGAWILRIRTRSTR